MRVMVLGADGYLGWPTCVHFALCGHSVLGVDDMSKRTIEREMGVRPLVETGLMNRRLDLVNQTGVDLIAEICDITLPRLREIIRWYEPDTIIHYAEQPSAPYSMMSPEACMETQRNNVLGTLSVLWAIKGTDIHLVKLGTMGEYGTPNIDIEEGWLTVSHNDRFDRMLYPKRPGSWYHASKVHDSANIEFACRAWGLRATDLNQGVVYGVPPGIITSFHYDAIFGTALNRFIAQAAVGAPLTVYGSGQQTRGWLNIMDTLQCVYLACRNPAEPGEFRVFNQFTEQFSVLELAEKVARVAGGTIEHIKNPRVEAERHYYNARHTGLQELGLKPQLLTDAVISGMLEYVAPHADNIDREQFIPTVEWK